MTRDDAAEIKRRLNERIEQVCDRFWPGNVKRGGIVYCAPTARKDDLGSFVVHLVPRGKNPRGKWFRNSAGIGGDELNLFAYGYTGQIRATAEVFQAAREFVGLDDARVETPAERERRETLAAEAAAKREADERRAQEHQRRRVRTATEDWSEGVPLAGTHGEAYFLARGLVMPPEGWGGSVRFHGRLIYDLDPSLSFPGIVCRVDDLFGDLTGVWKILLDPKKPAKAPVPKPKLGVGVALGGAVRLGGIGPHIGICEGVETGYAARALIKYRYPIWPALGTAGVAGFEPPVEVEWITAWSDGDKPWRKEGNDIVLAEPAGRAAVRKLRERMTAIDMKFDAQPEPPMRKDYLDVWLSRRRAVECN
jgi:hypothetical protein